MTQNGIVVAVGGENATVEFLRSEACAKCGACRLGTETRVRVQMPNRAGASVGDEVVVELHSGRLLRASAVTYLVPLAGLLIGLLLGQLAARRVFPAFNADLAAAAGALLGTALGVLSIYLTENKRAAGGQYAPTMLKIAPKEPNE